MLVDLFQIAIVQCYFTCNVSICECHLNLLPYFPRKLNVLVVTFLVLCSLYIRIASWVTSRMIDGRFSEESPSRMNTLNSQSHPFSSGVARNSKTRNGLRTYLALERRASTLPSQNPHTRKKPCTYLHLNHQSLQINS